MTGYNPTSINIVKEVEEKVPDVLSPMIHSAVVSSQDTNELKLLLHFFFYCRERSAFDMVTSPHQATVKRCQRRGKPTFPGISWVQIQPRRTILTPTNR